MSCPLISVIIPVWGDDDPVANLVCRVKFEPDFAEWVVAAVEPSEALRRLEGSGEICLVVCGSPSRGRQLNAAAAKARGTIFCFHHADSELTNDHLTALQKVAANEIIGGGAFHRRFSTRSGWYVGCEALLRCLSPFAGPLFGDQSIFVKAPAFLRS
ncbi:MAG: hypothetical protein JO076_05380 [Verrucomicrobia bacterium]|nr:hypothetical protein [Verrucomicrobiota bacterium]